MSPVATQDPLDKVGDVLHVTSAGFKMNGVKKNWIRKQETYEDVLFYQLIKS